LEHLRTKGFQQLTTVEDAKQIFFDAIGGVKVRIDTVRIQKAIGRILAQEVIAGRYLPAVDLSALDGYAVRSNDIMSALLTQPVILEVVGKSRLGEACGLKVGPGQAIAVATGSCMPQGASSVVMVERTNRLQGNKVTVHSPASPGQGVTRKGEDFAPGRLVIN
jgi:molybdopterin molybdotransferase